MSKISRMQYVAREICRKSYQQQSYSGFAKAAIKALKTWESNNPGRGKNSLKATSARKAP